MTDIANHRYGTRAFRWLVQMEMLKYEEAMMEFREMQKTAKRCAPALNAFTLFALADAVNRDGVCGPDDLSRQFWPKPCSSRRGGLSLKFTRPVMAAAHLSLVIS